MYVITSLEQIRISYFKVLLIIIGWDISHKWVKMPKSFQFKKRPQFARCLDVKDVFSSFQGGCAGSGCGKCDCHGVKGQKVSGQSLSCNSSF